MQKRPWFRPISVLALQLFLMIAAVKFGFELSRHVSLIPRWLLPTPTMYVSAAGVRTMVGVFAIAYFAIWSLLLVLFRTHAFQDPRRFSSDYLGYLCAFTAATAYLFFGTDISYDPQMIAAIGVLSTSFLFVAYSIYQHLHGFSLFTALAKVGLAIAKELFGWRGFVVIPFFLSMPLVAVFFYLDPSFANRITQLRIRLAGTPNVQWHLVSALGQGSFLQPMLAKSPPHNGESLYVLERKGRLLKVDYPSGQKKTVVLDISASVGITEMENGALGFAFHPDFGSGLSPNRGYVYLYYTAVRGGVQTNHVSRFDLAGGSAQSPENTEYPLLALSRESSGFHNGGSLEFGPDGYLYVAFGEGIRTPRFSGPNEVLRGGILRIDVDNSPENFPIRRHPANGSTSNYSIPRDNPFVGRTEILDEYWALGLRNPFRISFDSDTQKLWAGDVGSTVWEEVNVIEKGKHYQFPFIEGRTSTGTQRPPNLIGIEQGPVYTYEHSAFDRAVIGGIVYRGKRFNELIGKYVFADNYSSKVFAMPSDLPMVDKVETIARARQFAQRGISSLTALPNGDILVTVLGDKSAESGEILKLERKIGGQGTDGAPVKPSNGPPPFDKSTNYTPAAAKDLFLENCARCHGHDGSGGGPDAQSLPVVPTNFSRKEFQSSRSDKQIRDVIDKGGYALGLSPAMPPWGAVLRDHEIGFLVRYIREIGSVPGHHDKAKENRRK
jgi:glucose/arabinose dehydrogenase/mono/diheme cytochrome c family protein